MKIYSTKLSDVQKQLPSAYAIERILVARGEGLADYEEHTYSFYRRRKGLEGERTLLEFIEEFGQAHWVVFSNVWMNAFGTFECDVILVTRVGIFVFEVKNYVGEFRYGDGVCRLNGRQMRQNYVAQVRRARGNLEDMCREAGLGCRVMGVLLLIGEHCYGAFDEEVRDVRLVLRCQLRSFLMEIARLEESSYAEMVDVERLLGVMEKHEVMNPFVVDPVADEVIDGLRKGICCGRCDALGVSISKWYVTCACGFREPRDEAILRTICEYGVLVYDREELRPAEVYAFFGGEVSRDSVVKVLQAHFEFVDKNKHSYYVNKKLPYGELRF